MTSGPLTTTSAMRAMIEGWEGIRQRAYQDGVGVWSIKDNPDEIEIPDYVYDVHTLQGKRKGKTKKDFFIKEFNDLAPRVEGKFDDLINNLCPK